MSAKRTNSIGARIWSVGRWILIGLVVAAFVFVFGQPSGSGGDQDVAEVDGQVVKRDEFEFFRSQFESRQGELFGQNADAAQVRDFLDQQARETVIRRFVMAQEARSLGLRVSEAELREHILTDPGFQIDGRFDIDLFETFVARTEFDNERSFLDGLRRDLLIRKLNRLYQSPIRVSSASARARVTRETTTVSLRYAVARAEAFSARSTLTDDEVEAFAVANAADLQREYQARTAEFNRPEQARARHILFRSDDALERARAAKLRLDAGEDFASLATELSDDVATAKQGGDLGTFPRGRMFPEFDAAVFGAEAGTVVGPVESDRGVQLVRVEERIAGVSQGFDVVRASLARSVLQRSRGNTAAREAAEEMARQLEAGVAFDAAASAVGLELDRTTPFRFSERLVPGIGQVPGLRAEAFRLTKEAPVSRRVFGSQGAYFLISLADREEPDAEALEAGLEAMRDRMLAEARAGALQRLYEQRRQELVNAGKIELFALYPDR